MRVRGLARSALAAAGLVGAAAAAASVQPLRLCADPANMPFSSNAPEDVGKGAPGLYVEIGQAIADAIGRPMETVWSLSYFGKRNLRLTLLAGRCDLAVGLPAEQDFMGPRLIFSRPVLTLGYALVVPKGGIVNGLDDLKGKRVAVQFASPPQSLLATRDDITSVTTMNPEEAMRRLDAGEVDAAIVWGPNASYFNHVALGDRFDVHPVDAPHMQWKAAIGFSSKQPALRDGVDAVLERLAPRIRELGLKYAGSAGPPVLLAAASATVVAANDTPAAPSPSADAGDVAQGKRVFNSTCAHCHGPDAVVADRKINLRRLQLKYGDQVSEVFFKTVTAGRLDKGMPAWKDVFSHQDLVNVLAYLRTIQEH